MPISLVDSAPTYSAIALRASRVRIPTGGPFLKMANINLKKKNDPTISWFSKLQKFCNVIFYCEFQINVSDKCNLLIIIFTLNRLKHWLYERHVCEWDSCLLFLCMFLICVPFLPFLLYLTLNVWLPLFSSCLCISSGKQVKRQVNCA